MTINSSFLHNIDIINDDLGDIDDTENKNSGSGKDDKFAQNISEMISNINEQIKVLRNNKLTLLKLQKMYDSEKKKNIKGKKNETRKETGVMKETRIPDKLAEYLGVDKGSVMKRNLVSSKIYNKIKENGLCYENDKRVLRVDDKLQKLFNLSDPKKMNESTNAKDKDGFNFYTLSHYVAEVYKEEALHIEKKKKKKEKKVKKDKKDKKGKKAKKKVKKNKDIILID